MKRVVKIKGDDGEVRIEVTAKAITSGCTKDEVERLINCVARNLFKAMTEEPIPYTSFGVHNTTVKV